MTYRVLTSIYESEEDLIRFSYRDNRLDHYSNTPVDLVSADDEFQAAEKYFNKYQAEIDTLCSQPLWFGREGAKFHISQI